MKYSMLNFIDVSKIGKVHCSSYVEKQDPERKFLHMSAGSFMILSDNSVSSLLSSNPLTLPVVVDVMLGYLEIQKLVSIWRWIGNSSTA
jgi:hypothetical protein